MSSSACCSRRRTGSTSSKRCWRRAPDAPELGFLRAWLLRRQGRFAEALPLAEAAPASIEPARRAQLLGEIYDRLGDAPRAFAAFAEMNRAAVAASPPPDRPSYRSEVAASAARLSRWSPAEVEGEPPSPAFILGFPRSGTTLLDTLLLNMPELHVLEEMPVLDAVRREDAGRRGPRRTRTRSGRAISKRSRRSRRRGRGRW